MSVDLFESTRCGETEVVIGAELVGAVLGARGGALLDGRGMGVEGRGGAPLAAAAGGALFAGGGGGALARGADTRGGALLAGRGMGVEGRAAAGG